MDKGKKKVAPPPAEPPEERLSNLAQIYFYCEVNDRHYIVFEKSAIVKDKMNFVASTRSERQAKSLVHKLNVAASI